MAHRPPTLISGVLLMSLLVLFGHTDAYSKYGRSCSDIGCLSSETCVMAHDSCSYNQRENKDCGRYPTCRKSGASAASPGAALNPMPENTRPVSSNFNPNFNSNANQNPASAPQNPYPNIYPQIPNQQQPSQYDPRYPPQYPQYPQNPPPNYPGQYPGYQQPSYPNQPPPYRDPYGAINPNPYAGNQNQFGNQFPNYRNIPTTTEPSLWNQFLNNKGGRNYYGNGAPSKSYFLSTILALCTSLLLTTMFR